MERSYIHQMLSNYMNGSIDEKETSEIRQILRKTSNEELWDLLEDQWESYEPTESYERETQQLFKKIQQEIRNRKIKTVFMSFARKAAVFLLPILIMTTGYLLYEKQTSQRFTTPLSVHVDAGKTAEIGLPDGTYVLLNAESTITYRDDAKNSRRITTLNGEAYFKVKSNHKKPFVVNTTYFDIEVLGTVFNVMAYESEEILETSLSEGSIKITTTRLGNNKTIYVKSNQKALYNKKTGELHVVETNIYAETAWTKGILVFHSEPLDSIRLQLERKYNVFIHLNYPTMKKDRFTGIFDNKTLEEVLDILQLHYNFSYTIDGKNIEIDQRETNQNSKSN